MSLTSSTLLIIGLLSVLFINLIESGYPGVEPLPLKYTQVGRTEIAQKACAIPGPRGYRGARGPPGDKGPTGPQGVPGLLNSQVELLNIDYITDTPLNISFSQLPIVSPTNAGYVNPYGVLISRTGYPVSVLLTAVVNIDFNCIENVLGECEFNVGTGEALVFLQAVITINQVTPSVVGPPSVNPIVSSNPVVISIPVNYAALPFGGATGNIFIQSYYTIDALTSDTSSYYATVTLSSAPANPAPIVGFNYLVSGNMVASIYYGISLLPSPSPII